MKHLCEDNPMPCRGCPMISSCDIGCSFEDEVGRLFEPLTDFDVGALMGVVLTTLAKKARR